MPPRPKRKPRSVVLSGKARSAAVEAHAAPLAERIAHFLEVKKHHVSLKARAAYESAIATEKYLTLEHGTALRKDDADKTRRILADLGLNDWGDLAGELDAALVVIYKEGTIAGIDALGIEEGASFFDKLNAEAIAYAKERSAELVGMKWVNGELVQNPSADWAITDTTRAGLRDLIERAFTEGMSPTELGDAIEDSYLFSSARGDLIARTELAFAHTEGSNESMRASGVVTGKELIPSDSHIEDDCDDYFGTVYDLDDDEADPPIHPACECSLSYVLAEE